MSRPESRNKGGDSGPKRKRDHRDDSPAKHKRGDERAAKLAFLRNKASAELEFMRKTHVPATAATGEAAQAPESTGNDDDDDDDKRCMS